MTALAAATREVLKSTGVDGNAIAAIALDTTGSSVIPVARGSNLWTSTTFGAIIVPSPRPRRSPSRHTNWDSRALSGAAASTPTSGAF